MTRVHLLTPERGCLDQFREKSVVVVRGQLIENRPRFFLVFFSSCLRERPLRQRRRSRRTFIATTFVPPHLFAATAATTAMLPAVLLVARHPAPSPPLLVFFFGDVFRALGSAHQPRSVAGRFPSRELLHSEQRLLGVDVGLGTRSHRCRRNSHLGFPPCRCCSAAFKPTARLLRAALEAITLARKDVRTALWAAPVTRSRLEIASACSLPAVSTLAWVFSTLVASALATALSAGAPTASRVTESNSSIFRRLPSGPIAKGAAPAPPGESTFIISFTANTLS